MSGSKFLWMITISQHHKDGFKKRNLKPMGGEKMHTQHCQLHVPTIPRADWNALHCCWDQASQLGNCKLWANKGREMQ
jgi:hypothetical protein